MSHTRTMHWVSFALLGAVLLIAPCASAQSFQVQTTVTPSASVHHYSFTVFNDPAGSGPLTSDLWQWSFYMPPGTPAPVANSPSGWQFFYAPGAGQTGWFTEGSGGWASGDFGSNTIAPGSSLSGFNLTTAVNPGLSVASAYDTGFNFDATAALLPTDPPSVPEPSPLAVVVVGMLAVLLVGGYRRWKGCQRYIGSHQGCREKVH